jgi:hypothetical protein
MQLTAIHPFLYAACLCKMVGIISKETDSDTKNLVSADPFPGQSIIGSK